MSSRSACHYLTHYKPTKGVKPKRRIEHTSQKRQNVTVSPFENKFWVAQKNKCFLENV